MEHEIWLTAILNKLLAGVVSPAMKALGVPPADAAHPIPNYIAMELVVFAVIVVGALILRSRLSVQKPGKFQHIMESVLQFFQGLGEEVIGHGYARYVPLLGTLGIFILLCNILGLIPTLETPTGYIQVTLGCAVLAFVYYNFQGLRHHGLVGYLKTFWGQIWWLGPLLFVVEIASNLFRMLSLSVRLYANMFVGKLLEGVFSGLAAGMMTPDHGVVLRLLGHLTAVTAPAAMMGLHLFVSCVQAYIFVLLPAVYLSLAVSEEH